MLINRNLLLICTFLGIGCIRDNNKSSTLIFNHVSLFKNGRVKDSVFYSSNHPSIIYTKTYDLNGKLFFKVYLNRETKRDSVISFNDSGRIIQTDTFNYD